MRGLLVALITVLGLAAPTRAEPRDPNPGGLAFHLGVGNFYGGLGGGIEYQVPLTHLLRVTPFAGTGLSISEGIDPVRTSFGFAGGAALEAGRAHRGFLAVGFGTQGAVYDCDAGPCMNAGVVHGPFAVLGYKGTAPFGLMWLVYYGVGVALDDPFEDGPSIDPALGASLGWKL